MIPWRLKQLASQAKRHAADRIVSLTTRKIPLPPSVEHRRVIFVGASVGEDWRLHLVFPRIETLCIYQLDKGPLVDRAIASRPEAIIIKECAAYFPTADPCREMVQGWVEQIRAAGIRPVLATVVPVTRAHASQQPGRVEGLWAFNDWLRDFSQEAALPLLDLEAAVRCSASDRHLDPRLDSGDGLHLARRTYRRHLDPLIPPLLLKTFAPE